MTLRTTHTTHTTHTTRTPLILVATIALFTNALAAFATTPIDVLFAYTQEAIDRYPYNGDANELESRVRSRINVIHGTYAQYGIEVELRPHFFQTNWEDEAINTMPAMRYMLRNPDDGRLDDVFAAREAVAADLVVLFIGKTISESGVLGVAFTNGELGLTSTPDQPVLEDWAFAVVRSHSYTTFHHELQHLMGLNHGQTDNPTQYGPVFNNNAPTVAAYRDAGTTWDVCASGCPQNDLQAAITAAAPGTVLDIGPGSYPGPLTLDHELTLRGAGVNRTWIDGGGAANVFNIHGSPVTLAHLTITGGDGNTGSGIFNSGDLTLEEVVVAGNTGLYGGAILNVGSLHILRSRVKDNIFSFAGGFGGGLTNYTTLNLVDTRIEGNQGYLGGGLHNSGGTTDATGGWIKNNTSVSLGGGYSNHNYGGMVSLSGVTLASNHSDTGQYQQCYDIASPASCPALTPREACIDTCRTALNACRPSCNFTPECSIQCRAAFNACIASCPSS